MIDLVKLRHDESGIKKRHDRDEFSFKLIVCVYFRTQETR